MTPEEFDFYLNQSGVKRFCIRFNNSHHYRQFCDLLKGYQLVELEEASELKQMVLRPQLFQKSFYVTPFDSSVWQWSEKQQLASPFCMKAGDSRSKAVQPWEGPTDQQILAGIRADLEKRGCKFAPDGWKRLVEHYSSNGQLTDPDGVRNLGYSLGLQAEVVNAQVVAEILGAKAQIYDLFNALVAKNRPMTLKMVFLLVTDQEALDLTRGMLKMLSVLSEAQEAKETGVSSQDYAQKKNMHPYRAQKLFEQATQLTAVRKVELWDLLYQLDLRLKGTVRQLSPTDTFKKAVLQYLDKP